MGEQSPRRDDGRSKRPLSAMKVIESGNFNPKRISCSRCKAVLEFTREDQRTGIFGADYTGSDGTRKWYVDCPECGGRVFLSYTERFLTS